MVKIEGIKKENKIDRVKEIKYVLFSYIKDVKYCFKIDKLKVFFFILKV